MKNKETKSFNDLIKECQQTGKWTKETTDHIESICSITVTKMNKFSTLSKQDIEDIKQNSCLIFFKKTPLTTFILEDGKNYQNYLIQIIKNETLQMMKKISKKQNFLKDLNEEEYETIYY